MQAFFMKEDSNQTTLSIPYPSFQNVMLSNVKKIPASILMLFSRISNLGIGIKQRIYNAGNIKNNTSFTNSKRSFKKFIPLILLVIIVLPVILIGANRIFSTGSQVKGLAEKNTQNGTSLQIKTKNFGKKLFTFPIRNSSGKEVMNFKYSVESAELLNEIYIKGQKATALKDKLFLIVNLKLTNDSKQGISINARDYVRLSVNKKSEWLAPDIHNDPVEIQAISTKYTRVGFIVYTADANPELQIGEIDGTKQKIELKFK